MKNILLFLCAVCIGGISFFIYNSSFLHNQSLSPKKQKTLYQKFSIQNAPSESLRGKISSMSGEIAWQSRVATEPAKLTSKVLIQQGETLVTNDTGIMTIQFPSLGPITMFQQTTLNFIQTLPTTIVIEQPSGSADYQNIGKLLLTVRSMQLIISQTKGDMSIVVQKDTNNIIVTVKTGYAIAAYNDASSLSHVIVIQSGKQFTFSSSLQTGTLK